MNDIKEWQLLQRNPFLWGGLAICLACLAAFYPALGGGYVFDDHMLLENNSLLRGPLWRIWFSTDPVDYWPLTYTTFWLEMRIFGPVPFMHHLINLVLHAATAILLWRVLKRLEIPGAWLAGLLFVIHPVTVESVAWISERKNVLSGALYLSSIYWWLRYRISSRRVEYAAALGLFLLTLLAKTSAVALPLVLLGTVLWREGRLNRRSLLEAAPFFGLALLFGVITYWFQTSLAMSGGWSGAGWGERIGRSAWAWLTYLRHAFFPAGLAFLYPPWPVVSKAVFWVPLAVSGAMAGFLLWRGRTGFLRPLTFTLGYHLFLTAPVLGLVEISYFTFGPVSNHLQYLAIMGPVSLVAAVLATAAVRWRTAARLASALVVVVLIFVTSTRAGSFHDDLSLWKAAVRDAPQSFNAAWTLAFRLSDAGRPREARQVVEDMANRIEDPAGRLRAEAFLQLVDGSPEEAVALASKARDMRYDLNYQLDLGYFLINEGHHAAAVSLLQPELSRQPRNVLLRYRLGSALAKVGRVEDSIVVMREACGLSPRQGDSCPALVVLLARAGRPQDARKELAEALHVELNDPRVEEILRGSQLQGEGR